MAFDPDEALAQLLRTPAMLRTWLVGLPGPWLHANEGPGTFSPRDVLAHLIHGERVDWLPRVQIILEAGESRPFEPFDRRGFLDEAQSWEMEDLTSEFEHLRAANISAISGLRLAPSDLRRKGFHPGLGPVTLEQLLATWVVHDLGHLAQIARVMAKRYEAEVGPWSDYLPVLTR